MSERTEQQAVIEFCTRFAERLPGLARVFHIPNGEKRDKRTAALLKTLGVRPGVPDLCLPLPRRGYCGLWIELKTATGRLSPAQEAEIAALRAEGYAVAVCRGWERAAATLVWYCGGVPSEYGLGWCAPVGEVV
jgi:hypothetical protein